MLYFIRLCFSVRLSQNVLLIGRRGAKGKVRDSGSMLEAYLMDNIPTGLAMGVINVIMFLTNICFSPHTWFHIFHHTASHTWFHTAVHT